MDSELHRALGLTDEEAARVRSILGRDPNHLELAMYAVMWSEHCSYKSSIIYRRKLPTSGQDVLVGPGENAGVIDAGDGIAIALRIESHNHPSAIEPHQGAATGVGGIIRDIFTMGARPVALMDSLRVGPLDDPTQRWLLDGVVGGISSYGNSVGVPTVGGEVVFDRSYSGNPLVNVLCLGVLPASRLVLSRASGAGNLAVLLGATTGRDGIGGVSVLASAAFGAGALSAGGSSAAAPAAGGSSGELDLTSKRPSVQVGDPYEEKRLIEACLELFDNGLVIGIQDLGGAGLTCATSETSSHAGMGMDVNVAAVPRREPGMEAFEVMTSESQERMLAIVAPEDLAAVQEICARWEVRATEIGRVTDGGRLRVLDGWDGPVLADMPAASLADEALVYHRPLSPPRDLERRRAATWTGGDGPWDAGEDLCAMLVDPSWVYRQYDHQLFCNTVTGPGDDAAVLRLGGPGLPDTERAVALTTDGNGRWCAVDPRIGTARVLAEATLNIACAGARPAAVVNCLNFGNPEHPEVMWQLSEAVDGLAEACLALGLPVVGGNVSLYNETAGCDIEPTPVVGVVGLIDRLRHRPPGAVLRERCAIVLLGRRASELDGSRWVVELRGHEGGSLAAVDLGAHRRLVTLVTELVGEVVSGGDGLVLGAHDVSDGGLGITLAEMALRSGTGFRVGGIDGVAELWSEAPSRVVLAVDPDRVEDLGARAGAAGVPWVLLGYAGGDRLVVDRLLDLPLATAQAAWREKLPGALSAPSAH